jgi:non-lysosomal glucosylceramidase
VLSLYLVALFAGVGSARGASDPIPPHAWTRGIGQPFPDAGRPKTSYPIFDDGPMQGAPLGGLGAGALMRTLAGDFAGWHLNVGEHEYRSVPANMFSLFVQDGETKQAQALYAGSPSDGSLGAWQWGYPVGQGTYWGLYPRSGFVYDGLAVQASVEQYSPVLPDNYKESSYPVAVFRYSLSNPNATPLTVGVMFTWQNMLTPDLGRTAGTGLTTRVRSEGALTGVEFGRNQPYEGAEWDGTMMIGAAQTPGVSVGTFAGFDPGGNGADIWRDFAADGALNDTRRGVGPARRLAAGVSATVTLQPGQQVDIPFFLAWDQPVMRFGEGGGGGAWYKRHTAFFGVEGKAAWDIAQEAAQNHEAWLKAIQDWQAPILADAGRPDWFKTALFNELYYMVYGGTAWEQGPVGRRLPAEQLGGFLMLESIDYRFYATFDVDYYGSFALMMLWPELEARVIDDFASTTASEDATTTRDLGGRAVVRKLAGAIPHDLGGPSEAPWYQVNLYNISPYALSDVNRWKDLNPKFVLRLHRDAVLLGRPEIATSRYNEMKQAIAYLETLDTDQDGIPENENVPDQTYDTWKVSGVSAYSGGLWLAALAAAGEVAQMAGDPAMAAVYREKLARAQSVYEGKLWNGRYYDYDSSTSPTHDSIMSDQLAGQWYLDYVGLSVLPAENIRQSLRTIYEYNVLKFGDGQMGAVNGMRPDGKIDESSEQSQESWTGVSYAVAALMFNHGLREQAWKTAFGVYNVTYQRYGYWFRTPEAYNVTGSYRASTYLRPLSIWALELAYRQQADK